jgi:hypothetical protein
MDEHPDHGGDRKGLCEIPLVHSIDSGPQQVALIFEAASVELFPLGVCHPRRRVAHDLLAILTGSH